MGAENHCKETTPEWEMNCRGVAGGTIAMLLGKATKCGTQQSIPRSEVF